MLVVNTSKLPTDSFKRTTNPLSTISFTKGYIAKVIKNLNPNKAHGYGIISIRMLKIYAYSIVKLLELIFKSYIDSGKFPREWEKANAPVHIKNGKHLIEAYCPIS